MLETLLLSGHLPTPALRWARVGVMAVVGVASLLLLHRGLRLRKQGQQGWRLFLLVPMLLGVGYAVCWVLV